jgi:hypothetical protein
MSASVLTQRIAEAAKVLNPDSPSEAEKLIVQTLQYCDCDPESPNAEHLIHYVGLDTFVEKMEEDGTEGPRHRMMWDILLGRTLHGTPAPQAESETSQIVKVLKDKSNRPPGQWKDEELLEDYNQDCDPEIERALKQKAGEAPIIVFSNEEEGVVDVQASLKHLRLSRRRERMPETARVNGKIKRLYRVGEFPSLVMYQCPFHPDVILFDGYCDKDDVDWSEVGYEAMQFARLVCEADEQPTKRRDVLAFVEAATEGVETLKADYPKIGLEFDRLGREDDLPNLKQRHSGSRRTQDPINPGNKRRF